MDGNASAGGIGKGGPLIDPAQERAAGAEGEAPGAAAAPKPAARGGAPGGRFQALRAIGQPGAAEAPAPAAPAPAAPEAAREAPAAARPPGPPRGRTPAIGSGRMQVLGAMARGPAGLDPAAGPRFLGAMRAGAFESAGHRMWRALGEPGVTVDAKKAKEVLPPPVFALFERMRAEGRAPTIAELQERWLAEAESIEIRGPHFERLLAFAERAAAAEVAGLLGANRDAPIDPALAAAKLPPDALACFERLRAASGGGRVTVGDLARARAAEAAEGIRGAAKDGKLSKKEAKTLPESLQTILRTYRLEGRGPVARRRDVDDAAAAVAGTAGEDAAQRVRAASGANADGILSKDERKRLEAGEREAALTRWLESAPDAKDPAALARFLTDSVNASVRRGLGERDDAPIEDETARRTLPSDLYAAFRRLAGPDGTKPVTVGELRRTLAKDVERDAQAALADGSLNGRERTRLARWVDPPAVAAVREQEQDARVEQSDAVEAWEEEVEERYPSSFWDFFVSIFTVATQEARRTEERRRREDENDRRFDRERLEKKDTVKKDLAKDAATRADARKEIEAEARRKADFAASVGRLLQLEGRVQDRPLILEDGTVIRVERRPFPDRGLDPAGLARVVPPGASTCVVVVRGPEAAVAAASGGKGAASVGYFTAPAGARGRPRYALDWSGTLDPAGKGPGAPDAKRDALARLLEDVAAKAARAGA